MAYQNNKTQRAVISAPANSDAKHRDAVFASCYNHFSKVLTPELIIANRKACYATIINAKDTNGIKLEALVGSVHAKDITEAVIDSITTTMSTIPAVELQSSNYQT